MIRFFLSTPFHSFPTIPLLSLPGGPGDVPFVLDQNTVGWYIGLHCLVYRRAHELQLLFNNAWRVYVQARHNGWVVSFASSYTLPFFEIRGLKSSSALKGWHGSHGVGNIRCYTRLFTLPLYLKKCTTCRLCLAQASIEGPPCNVQAGFLLRLVLFQSIRHWRSSNWSRYWRWWRRFKLGRNRFRRGWAFHPFHLAIKIAKNCIDCFRYFLHLQDVCGVERCVMLAFGLFPIKKLALQVR